MNSLMHLILNGIQSGIKTSGKCTVVALTSALPREGVSYVTQSFAVELAERTGKRTLIADAGNLQEADMFHYNQVVKFCDRQGGAPQRRIRAAARAGRSLGALRQDRRSLPARAQGRRRGRGRAPVHEPPRRRRSARSVPGRRRTAPNGSRPCAQLSRAHRHRQRQHARRGGQRRDA